LGGHNPYLNVVPVETPAELAALSADSLSKPALVAALEPDRD
jgi:hypothetical protein